MAEIANFGVVLLMFAVGVQFSFSELKAARKTALIGGSVQILGTILLGFLLGLTFGWGAYGGLFLGCCLALSSTAVTVRVLEERGELGSSHGGIMLALCIVQDLSLVLMAALLPALSKLFDEGAGAFADFGQAIVVAAAFLAATPILAKAIIPRILSYVVRLRSPELTLLSVLALCIVAAMAAEFAGLGLAIGAFLAGIVVSESPYSHDIFSQIRPLRDVFASIFFVSIGMLLDPQFLLAHWAMVGAVVAVIILGKSFVAALGVYMAGWHGRVALISGVGLAQIGEFSFVLAMLGVSQGLIEPMVSDVILSSALVSILLWPFLYDLSRPTYVLMNRSRMFSRVFNRRLLREQASDRWDLAHARVLVLGGGRVGRYASDALRAKEIPHVVIDFDSQAIARLKEHQVPVIYGDASSEHVIKQAHPERALLAIVALPEAGLTEVAVSNLHRLAPELAIVARVRRGDDIPRMRDAGANGVVHGEFEAGVEVIRQTLDHLGYELEEIDRYVDDVRSHRYREGS